MSATAWMAVDADVCVGDVPSRRVVAIATIVKIVRKRAWSAIAAVMLGPRTAPTQSSSDRFLDTSFEHH